MHRNFVILAWQKSEDLKLFNQIRRACPKDDSMKYDSRVNHLNWESVSYSVFLSLERLLTK
jgi:upstream-binding transcription factor